MKRYDAIVVGLGAMGSAALYELARRGLRVLGLERFAIVHDRGSSHGQFRIIRRAYFEHADYIPLVNVAYEMWDELTEQAGESLLERVGLVLFGKEEGAVIGGLKPAIKKYRLDIERIDANAIGHRFDTFVVDPSMIALYEPDAGFLRVERCVQALADAAADHGAEIRTGVRVRSWRSDGRSATVQCDHQTYETPQLVLCPGAWANNLLGEMASSFQVRRKVQLWYRNTMRRYTAAAGFPVFAYDLGDHFFYGFPAEDGEMKLADHGGVELVTAADAVNRELSPSDQALIDGLVAAHLRDVAPPPIRHSVCMYTMTPDEHFVLGRHPDHANVAVAAGFSGHGFKFAPVVGRAIAELITEGRTALPIGFLSPNRPGI